MIWSDLFDFCPEGALQSSIGWRDIRRRSRVKPGMRGLYTLNPKP